MYSDCFRNTAKGVQYRQCGVTYGLEYETIEFVVARILILAKKHSIRMGISRGAKGVNSSSVYTTFQRGVVGGEQIASKPWTIVHGFQPESESF